MGMVVGMTPDEFRKQGRDTIEWLARYMEEVGEFPVRAQSAPGETRAKLPPRPPEGPEGFAQVLGDLEQVAPAGRERGDLAPAFAWRLVAREVQLARKPGVDARTCCEA